MMVKKYKGKVYGAELTSAEKKAMEIEVANQLAEFLRKNDMEISSMILWILHEQFKFGPKRLKQFYDNFSPALKDLADRYEMDEEDQYWLCMHQLKEYGIDIEEWAKEKSGS